MTREDVPFPSICLMVPVGASTDADDRVASYWLSTDGAVLQLSVTRREEGKQVEASERLSDRLRRMPLNNLLPSSLGSDEAPERAAAVGVDAEGYRWHISYSMWPDLAVLATVLEPRDVSGADTGWAYEAVRTIVRRAR